jgi:hypothetical protein
MKAFAFLGHAIPAAALTLLSAAASPQPLPHTSLNKSGTSHVYSIGPAPTRAASPAGTCAPDGLCLAVTLALDSGDPNLCGAATELAVSIGDSVNICYTVTNNSSTTLNYHSLDDDHVGNLLTNDNIALAPGASYQYNRTVTASTNPSGDTGTFTSTWTATDVLPGYTANDAATYNFVDVSATGTPLDLSDDGAAAITMPFAFSFYGASSSDLCIGNNGGLLFGVSSCSSFPYNNQALPTTSLANPAILPYWDDMLPNGTIYYAAVGTAPNRQFVVDYKDKLAYGDSGDPTGQTGATFEVILNEADGSIDFEYETTTFGGVASNYDNGVSATVGLQSASTFANPYSYNSTSLSDGLAIHWTPATVVTYTASAAATLDVGSPSIITTPNASTGFTPKVTTGSSATSPLLIDNVGNRDLDWSLTPPAANAHFPKTPRTVAPVGTPGIPTSPLAPFPSAGGKAKGPVPFGTSSVPVYATAVHANGSDYVSFDALEPGTANVILANSVSLFGITFVNDDFSEQYGVDYFQGDLYTISTLDGSATLIGNTGLVSCCMVTPAGMRSDPTNGITYLVITDYNARSSMLYTIDLSNASTTLIGPVNALVRDIAIDNSGLMYGVDSDADTLVAIDKTSGAAEVIGSLGIDAVFGQGLDFDAETGVLYLNSMAFDSATMYTVDPATGATTPIGPSAVEVDSMAIAKSGIACSTPADTPWLSYDVASGTVTPDPDQTNPATVNIGFDATDLAPGTYTANLCVYNNDLAHSRVAIPVHLTVTNAGPADAIFQDGFDGSGGGGGTAILSQTSSTTPIQGNSVACNDGTGTTSDNQYWRRYSFGEYGVTSSASVSSVDVSIEQTAGAPQVTVTLYTIPHGVAADTIDLAQLTGIGTATAPAPADAVLTSFNVAVAGTVADTASSDLVVEVSTPDGSSDGTGFFMGSTTSVETHPGFLSSAACGVTDPTTVGDLGFPNMHIIEAVNVAY